MMKQNPQKSGSERQNHFSQLCKCDENIDLQTTTLGSTSGGGGEDRERTTADVRFTSNIIITITIIRVIITININHQYDDHPSPLIFQTDGQANIWKQCGHCCAADRPL